MISTQLFFLIYDPLYFLLTSMFSFRNYVVQYVLELDNQHVTDELVKKLMRNYAHLARNKYGSHVVQKLLKLRGIDSKLIVVGLLREIDTLLLDPFGNYVIQTAWFVSMVRNVLKFFFIEVI